jgi:hypothetical protein
MRSLCDLAGMPSAICQADLALAAHRRLAAAAFAAGGLGVIGDGVLEIGLYTR